MFGFGKKKKTVQVAAPLTGNAVSLDQVPDPAFAQKIIGDGIAIEPSEGVLVSPVDGKVIHIIDKSFHSLVIGHESGLELLMHIGVNTVQLQGNGFKPLVKSGDVVKKGQPVIEFDMASIKEAGYPVITPVVIANGDAVKESTFSTGSVTAGSSTIMEVVLK